LRVEHVLKVTENKTIRDAIGFLGIRPTPGFTKSPYNGKYIPRIIIGMKPNVDKETIKQIIDLINTIAISTSIKGRSITLSGSRLGSGIQPRYSKKYNNLIYTAYGSADYKDGKLFKESVDGKKLFDKTFMQKTWSEWWYGPTDEDMAYPDKSKDPFLK
jgi:hypothetical protein